MNGAKIWEPHKCALLIFTIFRFALCRFFVVFFSGFVVFYSSMFFQFIWHCSYFRMLFILIRFNKLRIVCLSLFCVHLPFTGVPFTLVLCLPVGGSFSLLVFQSLFWRWCFFSFLLNHACFHLTSPKKQAALQFTLVHHIQKTNILLFFFIQ